MHLTKSTILEIVLNNDKLKFHFKNIEYLIS